MAKTVIGLFPSLPEAENIIHALESEGCSRSDICVIGNQQSASSGMTASLNDLPKMGVPEQESRIYSDRVRSGHVLVAVKAKDEKADRVASIMERGEAAASGTSSRTIGAGQVPSTEHRMPVVEEELQVGKRQVERGGVRIFSHVTEKPVEETISLREEKVNVERIPANRPAAPGEMNAFQDQTLEITETAEQPVVSKTARVVEEVVVDKQVEEHDATIRDKVRRKDVDVQRMAAGRTGAVSPYDADFRQDFQTNYGSRGIQYEQYAPAYEFGSTYGQNQQYKDWASAETAARRDWEARGHSGKWEDVKNAVRYGWERVRGRR